MSDTPRIILDFVGGSEDGARYGGVTAPIHYRTADHGRVGARFRVVPEHTFLHSGVCPSEYSDRHHEIYEIEDRRNEWDHIYIRAVYLGREDSFPLEAPTTPIK